MKTQTSTSLAAYKGTVRRIKRWADSIGVVDVRDVTPGMLDEWRSSWTPDDPADPLALTTQAALVIRVRSFFRQESSSTVYA
jgi:hypothetical protein